MVPMPFLSKHLEGESPVEMLGVNFEFFFKGTFQKLLSGFFPLRGYPPPTPLTENQCEKKKVFFLSGKGGYPLSPLSFSGNFFPKRTKNDAFFIE